MTSLVEAENGVIHREKHNYTMWETLFELDTKYVPIKPIGKGAYGVVCSSVDMETQEKVAIKKIQNVFQNHVDCVRTLCELKILRQIKHDNVIALKDVMMPSRPGSFNDLYLVYELMDTDLNRIIKSSQHLSNDHIQYLMLQILSGLKYLHSANVLHRDLKPANLLVNADSELKICDFGLARTANCTGECMTEYVVTRWYRAPELLLGSCYYDTSIDMWSAGCVFAELLGRKPIFPGTNFLNQLQLVIDILGSQTEADLAFIDNLKAKRFISSLPFSRGKEFACLFPNADPLAIDLLQQMLVFDPSKRIGATEALSHPYFSGLYNASYDPPAKHPLDLDVDEDMDEEMTREMILREVLLYHPETNVWPLRLSSAYHLEFST